MFFFKKKTDETPETQFIKEFSAFVQNNQGQVIKISQLNELLRKSAIYTQAFYATTGFSQTNLQAALEAQVSPRAQDNLAKLKDNLWQAELATDSPEKSQLNLVITSEDRYFKLSIKPTLFKTSLDLANRILPEAAEYKKDRKAGEFVLNTIKELLFASYRLDLARTPNLEEALTPVAEISPASTLLPIYHLLVKIEKGNLSDLDIQYLFTWLLQYSATITATSSIFGSYSSAILPGDVIAKTEQIVQDLSTNISQLSLSENESAQDSLALSQQLLTQLPDLYQDANQKMAQLDQQLQASQEENNES